MLCYPFFLVVARFYDSFFSLSMETPGLSILCLSLFTMFRWNLFSHRCRWFSNTRKSRNNSYTQKTSLVIMRWLINIRPIELDTKNFLAKPVFHNSERHGQRYEIVISGRGVIYNNTSYLYDYVHFPYHRSWFIREFFTIDLLFGTRILLLWKNSRIIRDFS